MERVRAAKQGSEGRAREIPALLFALLWLLGFEAGPALHLARHATLPQHDHCHDGVCHDDVRSADERSADARSSDALGGAPGAEDHGEGSLEHGGLAALTPAPIVTAIVGALVAEIVAPTWERALEGELARARARARAPPVDVSRV